MQLPRAGAVSFWPSRVNSKHRPRSQPVSLRLIMCARAATAPSCSGFTIGQIAESWAHAHPHPPEENNPRRSAIVRRSRPLGLLRRLQVRPRSRDQRRSMAPTIFVCQTLSLISFVRRAARGAPISDQPSIGRCNRGPDALPSGGLNRPKCARRTGIRTCEGFCPSAGQALFERCWADHRSECT